MHQTILISGIACLIAAIVGGGLKAFQIEIPVVNSPVRQAILGAVGLAMIWIGLVQPFSGKTGAGSANNGGASPPASEEDRARVLAVQCTAEPSSVSAGDQARIRVRIVTERGTPVSNARVQIRSSGGRFLSSESAETVGRTNGEGLFVVQWQVPTSPQSGYAFDVAATKEGFDRGEGRCRVAVSTQDPSSGGAISVQCTVEPHAIAAGERAAIRILALTERDEPVQGARVKISSGGGWFSGSGTTTEVGQTGENGVFATQWRAPDPAARAYGMSVRVNKEGFTGGDGKCNVPIE